MAPANVFKALAFFNALRWPLIELPSSLAAVINGLVSVARVQKFMNRREVGTSIVQRVNDADDNSSTTAPLDAAAVDDATSPHDAVEIKHPVSFAWSESSGAVLRDICFSLKSGSLNAIVGPVGCGKTSLVLSLIGELAPIVKNEKGTGPVVYLRATKVAYASQVPWLMNATVRHNVSNADAQIHCAWKLCCAPHALEVL